MSIADPLQWLRDYVPGETAKELSLSIRDGELVVYSPSHVYTFKPEHKQSLKAVIDWLEKSPVYVWPYANVEYIGDDLTRPFERINITIGIDCTAVGAFDVDGTNTSSSYYLAHNVARTLDRLAEHVYEHTKTRIFINNPK